ncbi:MAG: 3-isopropylmalate dehydratase small subunit [Desulfobacterales bacterium]|nr:3-isopropylmalate dehydratase small subunit [Desulfobacterales bacterium]
MTPFTTHRGVVATLNRANVDTDAIIPKQFLKSIKRTGYGPSAFFDWRYTADGQPDPGFELNQSRFAGRSILVTRNNFGCGSSREHAVWALAQDGYRVVIAPWLERDGKHLPGFADIFRSNTTKNGLLAIELPETAVDTIFAMVADHQGLEASVDLADQQVTLHGPEPVVFKFEIDTSAKEQLLNGLDGIDLTLAHADAIDRFERAHETWR